MFWLSYSICFQGLPPDMSIGDAARAALFNANFPMVPPPEEAAMREMMYEEVGNLQSATSFMSFMSGL